MWAQQSRNAPAATAPPTPAPTAPDGRRSGSIDDPKAIDFSSWIAQAPAWPPGQPSQYLIFDIAALEGWTQLDQTGGHQIGDGANYHWSSNVNDPEGTQFNLSISNSIRYPSVASGDVVDINGVDGNLGEGEVSWPLDDTHTATVVEFGTADTDRAVGLARELTTTTAQSISTREPRIANGRSSRPERCRVQRNSRRCAVVDLRYTRRDPLCHRQHRRHHHRERPQPRQHPDHRERGQRRLRLRGRRRPRTPTRPFNSYSPTTPPSPCPPNPSPTDNGSAPASHTHSMPSRSKSSLPTTPSPSATNSTAPTSDQRSARHPPDRRYRSITPRRHSRNLTAR